MLKSNVGTERSDHRTTWARMAVAEALLIENRVLMPSALFRSTSKYGRSSVAAGESSMVQMKGGPLTPGVWAQRPDAPTAASSRPKTKLFFMIRLLRDRRWA